MPLTPFNILQKHIFVPSFDQHFIKTSRFSSPLHPVESRPLTRWSQRNLGHRASHHDSCRTGNRHLDTVFLRTRLLETVKHQLLNLGKNTFQGTKISHLGKRKIDKSCSNIRWVVPRRVTIFLHSPKWSFANQASVLVDILRSLRILFLRVGWSQNRRPSK